VGVKKRNTGTKSMSKDRIFTGKITKEELAGAVAYAFSQSERFDGAVPPSSCKDAIDFLKKNGMRTGQVTKRIEKDLRKVQFDEENLEWENGEGYSGTKRITGFHTLPNGLTYLGVCAGGDWEVPLFYIVYYDGETLRGYIPKDGNHWNTKTKTAYGSESESFSKVEYDEEDANANVQERFGVSSPDELPDMDTEKILADIQSRIVFDGDGNFMEQKGLKDINFEI